MNLYEITVHGCDDSTTVLKVINSKEELDILQSTANSITQASIYGCMPTMKIKKIVNQDDFYEVIESLFDYDLSAMEFYFKNHTEESFLIESWNDTFIERLQNQKEFLNVLQLELKPVEDVFSDDYLLVKTGDTKALIDSFAEKA